MEYIDIVDEHGIPTGETIERSIAHSKGIRHRTVHMWIVRKINDRYQVLMQKRAMNKNHSLECLTLHQQATFRPEMSRWSQHYANYTKNWESKHSPRNWNLSGTSA